MWLLFLSIPALVTWVLGRTLGSAIRPYSRTLAVAVCAAIVPGALIMFAAYIAIRDSLYPDPRMLDGIPPEYIMLIAAMVWSPITLIISIVAITSHYRDKA